MDNIAIMRAFIAVVDANGFTNASRVTNASKALLSKYVAALEERLGVRLLQRTTRNVYPTEVGKDYYSRCLVLLEEFDELESYIQNTQSRPSGELKISVPGSFAELHLMKLVSQFNNAYPDIRINMTLTDRRVDIIEQGYDLAIRISNLPDSSFVTRKLTDIRVVAYASHDYLAQAGEPKHPNDLYDHKCIIDTNVKNPMRWNFSRERHKTSIHVNSAFHINSGLAVKELVLDNQGIAIGPMFIIAKDLKTKRIKLVLSDYDVANYSLFAIYAHRRFLPAKVRLFIDALNRHFSMITEWQ